MLKRPKILYRRNYWIDGETDKMIRYLVETEGHSQGFWINHAVKRCYGNSLEAINEQLRLKAQELNALMDKKATLESIRDAQLEEKRLKVSDIQTHKE